MFTLTGCREIIGLDFAIKFTLPNTFDEFCAEETVGLYCDNLTNHVAVINANEIQRLYNITNTHLFLRFLTV
jgi:hypothetical protein